MGQTRVPVESIVEGIQVWLLRKVNIDTDLRIWHLLVQSHQAPYKNTANFDPRKFTKAAEDALMSSKKSFQAFGCAGHGLRSNLLVLSDAIARYASFH